MAKTEIENWKVMYVTLRFDKKNRPHIYHGGENWSNKKGGGRVPIKDKSLIRLIASGAEEIKTSIGEIYKKELDRAILNEKNIPERTLLYLRTNPPSVGYESFEMFKVF